MLTTLIVTLAGWAFSLGSQLVAKKLADDAAKQQRITDIQTAFNKAKSDLLQLHRDPTTPGGAS
jgi:hypothetical protein